MAVSYPAPLITFCVAIVVLYIRTFHFQGKKSRRTRLFVSLVRRYELQHSFQKNMDLLISSSLIFLEIILNTLLFSRFLVSSLYPRYQYFSLFLKLSHKVWNKCYSFCDVRVLIVWSIFDVFRMFFVSFLCAIVLVILKNTYENISYKLSVDKVIV